MEEKDFHRNVRVRQDMGVYLENVLDEGKTAKGLIDVPFPP